MTHGRAIVTVSIILIINTLCLVSFLYTHLFYNLIAVTDGVLHNYLNILNIVCLGLEVYLVVSILLWLTNTGTNKDNDASVTGVRNKTYSTAEVATLIVISLYIVTGYYLVYTELNLI